MRMSTLKQHFLNFLVRLRRIEYSVELYRRTVILRYNGVGKRIQNI